MYVFNNVGEVVWLLSTFRLLIGFEVRCSSHRVSSGLCGHMGKQEKQSPLHLCFGVVICLVCVSTDWITSLFVWVCIHALVNDELTSPLTCSDGTVHVCAIQIAGIKVNDSGGRSPPVVADGTVFLLFCWEILLLKRFSAKQQPHC